MSYFQHIDVFNEPGLYELTFKLCIGVSHKKKVRLPYAQHGHDVTLMYVTQGGTLPKGIRRRKHTEFAVKRRKPDDVPGLVPIHSRPLGLQILKKRAVGGTIVYRA